MPTNEATPPVELALDVLAVIKAIVARKRLDQEMDVYMWGSEHA